MSQSLILQKPTEAVENIILPQGQENYVLDFPVSDVLLTQNGNDLVFDFNADGSIVLKDFYSEYTSDTLPSFEIDGAVIDGETFFTALNAMDIMPAAGPAQSQAPATDGTSSFVDFSNANLMDGVDNLDGGNIALSGLGSEESSLFAQSASAGTGEALVLIQ